MNENDIKQIESAVLKKALGYDTKEVVEEFQDNDGEVKLTKRKVTTKNVPPDMTAVKILLDIGDGEKDVESMTDEELEMEKQRLLTLLEENSKEN